MLRPNHRRWLRVAVSAFALSAVLGACADSQQGGLWHCRAHSGPEPAELLDWQSDLDEDHPDVSCRVGEGIRTGWWRWHALSADECRSVTVRPSATAELPEGQSRSRRNAREPIILNSGDVVTGFTTEDLEGSGSIAATSLGYCFLEYHGPDPPLGP